MDYLPSVLVAEDDKATGHFISTILKSNNYRVLEARTGSEAVSLAASCCPELVLLNLGLPDMDGMEVIKEIREWSDMQIIVLSARTDEADKVAALDLGADDYITKPFGTLELLARMRTALRHGMRLSAITKRKQFTTGELVIDYFHHNVVCKGKQIHLTPIEYKILVLLSTHAEKVLTHDFIIKEIWGPFTKQTQQHQILRVNMANIRKKIEDSHEHPKYILTEAGIGYRMVLNPT